MSASIFISHSSRDVEIARALKARLERTGLTTFMAPDDMHGAEAWPRQLARAIEDCAVMVLLFSASANNSEHVAREVSKALGSGRPLLALRLDATPAAGSLSYLLELQQWIDIFPGPLEHHVERVIAQVRTLLSIGGPRQAADATATPSGTCPSCAAQNQPTARFCSACAAPLSQAPDLRQNRRVVTVLFSDVTGSTALGERLDPETLRTVMGRYFGAMKAVIERHGGTVEKFIGDAVMAVFGIPTLHEDDALRAVRAAAEMRDALEHLNRELEIERGVRIAVRTGVNTGEVVAGDPGAGQTLVTGDTVNTAARLEQAAGPGEILLGEGTARLVRDAVVVEPVPPLEVKGKAQPLAALRLLSVTAGAEAHARRLDAPLVGRQRELDRLRSAFESSVSERACQLFTLLGSAGVGKSRLTGEFVASVSADATVLRGRCLPYGEGITYWPVGEVVRDAAGISEVDTGDEARAKLDALLEGERDADTIAARVAAAIGLSTEAAPQEELFWAVRRLLEALARRRPLVVVWDDIHWGEPTFLDLIEHIADWSRNVPLLLLCPARPELLDIRAGWGGGKLNATTILLEPLPPEAAARLIEHLPGGTVLDAETRRRITDAAEGNPLYVEEMLGMLVDDGYLRQTDSGWTAARDLASVRVPPSIQALLAARLDRLGPDERAVAERAAVVGRVFERSAVAELASEALRPTVTRHLLALVRKELVRPDEPGLAGDDAFRFRHILIRDAAYDSLPKAERAELHERFADWLERTAGDRAIEYEEIVAHHLEQAHRYREQLGETGERVEQLRERAGIHLAAAGRRAMDHDDARGALPLLERAIELVGDAASRIELLLLQGLALSRTGSLEHLEHGVAVLERAETEAAAMGDERLLWLVRLELGDSRSRRDTSDLGDAVDLARGAIDVFERLGDARGLANAWGILSGALMDIGRVGDAADGFEKALEWSRRAADRMSVARALSGLVQAWEYGPTPASDATDRCEQLLREGGATRRTEAVIRIASSSLYAMQGRFDEARANYGAGRAVIEELDGLNAAGTAHTRAEIELLADAPEAAERELRAAYAMLERAGDRYFFSSVVGLLAEVLAILARDDEAARYADVAREEAKADDFFSQVLWRRVCARVAIRHNETVEAERFAREAVEIASATDDLNTRGACALVLGDVLRAAGRLEEAAVAVGEAIAFYAQKGNLVMADRAASALSELGGRATAPAM